jgi:alkylated DNA repair protein alkB family protein 6
MYNEYMHGILEKEKDILDETVANLNKTTSLVGSTVLRTTRISLTIRHVMKTKKIKIKLSR